MGARLVGRAGAAGMCLSVKASHRSSAPTLSAGAAAGGFPPPHKSGGPPEWPHGGVASSLCAGGTGVGGFRGPNKNLCTQNRPPISGPFGIFFLRKYFLMWGGTTGRSTGRSGRQNAAPRRNMRREERVTVQGPVKKQQPDGMSHRGGASGGGAQAPQ